MLWALLTVAASALQTARNALQRGLTAEVGTLGATHARFLYGLPFAALVVVGLWAAGQPLQAPGGAMLGWAALGGLAQIGATALLLAAMQSSAFMLAVAYTKSEPVLVLVAAGLVVGETPTPGQSLAIVAATAGVLLMAWPAGAARATRWWRPVVFGIGSGALFAVSAVAFREAVLSLDRVGFLTAATTTLAIVLAIQTAVLSAWLAVREPGTLHRLIARPGAALPAGATGAAASACWFMAFALASAPLVRTLALVEIVFSHLVTQRVFAETISPREGAGAALLVLGIAGLFLGG
ncbi:MAG: DMT family transporter [Pseudomonadota bacterium]